jgi:putative MATE family efflux protein
MQSVAKDPATIDAGMTFLFWALPGWVSALPMSVLSGALRGTGIMRPTLIIYTTTILLNILLAPFLISGWVTGVALGVMGAGIATSISGITGVILLTTHTRRAQKYLIATAALLKPRLSEWRRILRIGLPIGSEMLLTFASAAVILHAISGFGASAQAGFSIGQRILQVILVPGLAVAYAAGPIAGQNFGAKKSERVREVFRHAVVIGTGITLVGTILLQSQSQLLLSIFDADPAAVSIARSFLLLMSWTLVAQMLIYTCKIMFTGLGNTMPSLLSSCMQFAVFAVPALWLSTQSNFRIEQIWYLSIGSMTLQALVSLWLLRWQFRRSLVPEKIHPTHAPVSDSSLSD